MAHCLISFGANIGDALGTIQAAAASMREQLCGSQFGSLTNGSADFQLSRCFRTPPVGGPTGQPPFINAVAAVRTNASPWEVWHCIRRVEKEFGRERNLRWEARRIDLDILLYDDVRIWTPHLKIPHPRMCMRRFILLPAAEVAESWVDPVSGWSIGQLAANVRSGASNFLLVGEASSNAESLLAEVARHTGAQWRAMARNNAPHTRWVSARTTTLGLAEVNIDSIREEFRDSKLLIVLAPSVQIADVAWEDYNHLLASRLGLVDDSSILTLEPGPRYLLASSDLSWAIQELIAALEAMDCPIEAL